MVQLRSSVRKGTQGEPYHSAGRRSVRQTGLQDKHRMVSPPKLLKMLSIQKRNSKRSLSDGDAIVVAHPQYPRRKSEMSVSGKEAKSIAFESDLQTYDNTLTGDEDMLVVQNADSDKHNSRDSIVLSTVPFLAPSMDPAYNSPCSISWQQNPIDLPVNDSLESQKDAGEIMTPGFDSSLVDDLFNQINSLNPSDFMNIDPTLLMSSDSSSAAPTLKTNNEHNLRMSRGMGDDYTGMTQLDTDSWLNVDGGSGTAQVGYSSAHTNPQRPLTSYSNSEHGATKPFSQVNRSSRRLSPAELKWIAVHAYFHPSRAMRVVKHIFGVSQPQCLLKAIKSNAHIIIITQKMLDEFEGEFCHGKWSFEEFRRALTTQRSEISRIRSGSFSLWSIPVEVRGFTRQCDCPGC